jgi:hypothetical protein
MKALVLLLLITASALMAAYYAIATINLNGIYPSNWTEAQLIHDRCRLRLVQPEWVSSNSGITINWMIAETKARVAVIAILWLGGVIYTIRYESFGQESIDANS